MAAAVGANRKPKSFTIESIVGRTTPDRKEDIDRTSPVSTSDPETADHPDNRKRSVSLPDSESSEKQSPPLLMPPSLPAELLQQTHGFRPLVPHATNSALTAMLLGHHPHHHHKGGAPRLQLQGCDRLGDLCSSLNPLPSVFDKRAPLQLASVNAAVGPPFHPLIVSAAALAAGRHLGVHPFVGHPKDFDPIIWNFPSTARCSNYPYPIPRSIDLLGQRFPGNHNRNRNRKCIKRATMRSLFTSAVTRLHSVY